MSWDYVSSRLGNVPPATLSIAKEIYEAADEEGHEIWFMWGMGRSSEHSTGRALDFMVRNKAAGDWIRNYVWANRKRLRLRHVIWWQRITSTVVSPGVVRMMHDRGNNTANHKDHPHIFVFPGAYQAPPRAEASANAGLVRKVQGLLKVKVDGKWGPITDSRANRMRQAARRYSSWRLSSIGSPDISGVQAVTGTKVDGIWGPLSQASLENWIKEFQTAIGVSSDGLWGPKTDAKYIQVRRKYLNNW